MGKKANKAQHPTDAFRKEERKKEIKRNKFQKSQVRVGHCVCATDSIQDETYAKQQRTVDNALALFASACKYTRTSGCVNCVIANTCMRKRADSACHFACKR